MSSKLKEKLDNNKFVVTAEIFPPKGTDIQPLLEKADKLKGIVDAINVTDCQRSVMRISSLAVSAKLIELGIEPVFQLTCRDRNRLALQSDILGAHVLGIRNILTLWGDLPEVGDHKNAKPVFDLTTLELISVIRSLNNGHDMQGKELKGNTDMHIGAACNPNDISSKSIDSTLKKIDHGAHFFQTQPIFDINNYIKFKEKLNKDVKIIVGVLLLKSYEFAKRISKVPGIDVPKQILERLENSKDQLNEGIKIAKEQVKDIKQHANGVHVMAIGMEEYIPKIVI